MTKITAIMACDPNGVVGFKGELPWSYPDEISHFRNTTENELIIMGYNTYLSIPSAIFKTRDAIILSKKRKILSYHDNLHIARSVKECINILSFYEHKKPFIVGGARLVEIFIRKGYVDEFLLTRIHKSYKGDRFFFLKLLNEWNSELMTVHDDFTIYKLTRTKIL